MSGLMYQGRQDCPPLASGRLKYNTGLRSPKAKRKPCLFMGALVIAMDPLQWGYYITFSVTESGHRLQPYQW